MGILFFALKNRKKELIGVKKKKHRRRQRIKRERENRVREMDVEDRNVKRGYKG